MAFPLAGQRGDAILQALEAADRQKEKHRDSGSLSYGSGVPDRSESPEFSKVGNLASFRQEVNEAQGYFYDDFMPRLREWDERNSQPQNFA